MSQASQASNPPSPLLGGLVVALIPEGAAELDPAREQLQQAGCEVRPLALDTLAQADAGSFHAAVCARSAQPSARPFLEAMQRDGKPVVVLDGDARDAIAQLKAQLASRVKESVASGEDVPISTVGEDG
jgi:predicted TIM-barrel fold metal-dependent hydrolase